MDINAYIVNIEGVTAMDNAVSIASLVTSIILAAVPVFGILSIGFTTWMRKLQADKFGIPLHMTKAEPNDYITSFILLFLLIGTGALLPPLASLFIPDPYITGVILMTSIPASTYIVYKIIGKPKLKYKIVDFFAGFIFPLFLFVAVIIALATLEAFPVVLFCIIAIIVVSLFILIACIEYREVKKEEKTSKLSFEKFRIIIKASLFLSSPITILSYILLAWGELFQNNLFVVIAIASIFIYKIIILIICIEQTSTRFSLDFSVFGHPVYAQTTRIDGSQHLIVMRHNSTEYILIPCQIIWDFDKEKVFRGLYIKCNRSKAFTIRELKNLFITEDKYNRIKITSNPYDN